MRLPDQEIDRLVENINPRARIPLGFGFFSKTMQIAWLSSHQKKERKLKKKKPKLKPSKPAVLTVDKLIARLKDFAPGTHVLVDVPEGVAEATHVRLEQGAAVIGNREVER